MDTLVKKAYENWINVIEYDGKSLLGSQLENSSASRIDVPMASQDYSNSFDQQFTLPALPVPVPSEQPTIDSGLGIYSALQKLSFFYFLSLVFKYCHRSRLSYHSCNIHRFLDQSQGINNKHTYISL